MKVIFTQGLSGSGKSTWAKKFCKDNKDWVRVNRDDLRWMRGEYWVPKQEDLITAMEKQCVYLALTSGYNVIIDATNLNQKFFEDFKTYIRSFASDVIIETKSFLDVPVEECIKRDASRPDPVGRKVIEDMAKRYGLIKQSVVYTVDSSLPWCIICDIDGTLALHNGRSPYDLSRVKEDNLNIPVADVLSKYMNSSGDNETFIVFMSGREGTEQCRKDTTKWLNDNGFPANLLYMRAEGDMRNDAIIKKELFDEHIRGKFNVLFVLDDRNRCVELWRNLGLSCFQVNYGDF